MRRFVPVVLLALAVAGCDEVRIESESEPGRPDCPDGDCDRCPKPPPAAYRAVPPMDLPPELRQANYAGGSCVHAAMVSVLRWQGLTGTAAAWRRSYSGGEYASGLEEKAERAGLKFAYTFDGDPNFLEWCSRTRRGAVIFYKPAHAICFCGYVGGNAVVMDNNATDRLERIPKAEFLRRWKGYGGVALTPVYSPAPPRPYLAAIH